MWPQLGGGFKYVLFPPQPGTMIQFINAHGSDDLTNIFQTAWNHHLDI